MKKTYIAPSAKVFFVKTQYMIAASPLGGSTPGDEYSSSDVSYSNEGGGWFSED